MSKKDIIPKKRIGRASVAINYASLQAETKSEFEIRPYISLLSESINFKNESTTQAFQKLFDRYPEALKKDIIIKISQNKSRYLDFSIEEMLQVCNKRIKQRCAEKTKNRDEER